MRGELSLPEKRRAISGKFAAGRKKGITLAFERVSVIVSTFDLFDVDLNN